MEFHAKPSGLKRWLTSVDHKEIGIMYMWFAFIAMAVGGLMALLLRWELMSPDTAIVYDETYNGLFTVHALTMIFLFVMPLFAGLGNFFVPLQIGAPDMAFPRINALGFWLLIPGALLVWAGSIFQILGITSLGGKEIGIPSGGWTMYAPLNGACPGGDPCLPNLGLDFLYAGLVLLGASSLMGAINFLVTMIKMRRPGLGWMDMSLFSWSILTMSVLLVFGLPTLTVGIAMMLMDRNFGTGFFVPAAGGDVILWQHLFWFFGHPEVYILILPAFGMISEVLPRMARKPMFGYKAMVFSIFSIGFLGFTVWVHHMFTTGISPYFRSFFMAMTFAIGIPTGVKIFNWLATLWHGQIQFKAPLLFAVGFISMFLIGGINGVFVASIPLDYNLHDTYWVVSHLHYVLFGGSAMAIFAGMYYWFPRLTGRMYSERLAFWHFVTTMIGLNMVFFTMHFLGLAGMPRRYATYDPAFLQMNVVASIGSFILGFSTLLFFINFLWSMKKGPIAPDDPWRARMSKYDGWEWNTMPRVVAPPTPMPYEVDSAAPAHPEAKPDTRA